MLIVNWSRKETWVLRRAFLYTYISQSVAVCTGYVVTEHEGNMNMGQYYS
jgi:hypothetical protein